MQKESLSDALIEYLKTEASFPLFFPPRLRGSCANLFLDVIRHQNVREPGEVVIAIVRKIARKSNKIREVEAIFLQCVNNNLDEVVEYAKNRILREDLSPDDKELSRAANARMAHVYLMRKEIEHQKSIIMQ